MTVILAMPTVHIDQKISIKTGNFFPYLDTELVWSDNGDLQFRLHFKPNQQLKYLNAFSIHTKACFNAIPSGIYKRLSKLTRITEINKKPPLDKIYPQCFQALQPTDLVAKKIPTLIEHLQHNKEAKALKQAKDESNNRQNRQRTIHFCIRCPSLWSKPVHSIIKTIKDKFNLQWLRVSMACHRFTNLREIF